MFGFHHHLAENVKLQLVAGLAFGVNCTFYREVGPELSLSQPNYYSEGRRFTEQAKKLTSLLTEHEEKARQRYST